MDPLTTSALISAGGNILSGLSGFFGGEEKGPSLQEQSQLARKHEIQSFDDRIRSLEKHGINKMMALGMNPASGGMQFQFGGSGDSVSKSQALSEMGQGISRAASAFDSSSERELKKLTLASAAADVEGKHLENARLRSELALMNGAGPMPTFSGPVPRVVVGYDADGRVVRTTNPDLGDNEFLMMHDYLTRTLPDDVKNMAGRTRDSVMSSLRRAGDFFRERR